MKSALIVDAYPGSRTVPKLLLEMCGFQVDEVGNGKEACEYCDNFVPNLILIGEQATRSEVNGCIEALRLRIRGQKASILLCTDDMSVAATTSALRAGADELILKPFDAAVLRAKLQRLSLLDDPSKPRVPGPASFVTMHRPSRQHIVDRFA